eukprot:TRINITY_DN434_c0_g1_i6.p1 TRINITY_DN434_c0_g1~~TRINITY_DN434_c0_g1_i6.p1  ORF type:complete len:342 (+),score=117.19 TRINITY_DN434_c0_g1_i6:257-1282(+)
MTSGTVRVNKEQQAAMAFFASAPADPDPAGDSWGPTADACLWIPGGLGSMGVLAVRGDNGLVVLKPASGNAPLEYFALLFTRAMGVDTPHAHAVPRDSAAITAFLRRVEHGEVAFANPVDEDRMTGFFAREYFIVLGYAAGDTIVGMVGSIAQQLVLKARSDDGEAKTKGDAISASVDVDAIHAAVRARFCVPALEQLGAIAAVDLAINNFDRFPLGVWDNAGNPGNVIVDASVPPKVVAIDHALLPVDVEAHPAAWDRYISRVRTRTREVDEWWAKHGDGHGDGDPAYVTIFDAVDDFFLFLFFFFLIKICHFTVSSKPVFTYQCGRASRTAGLGADRNQ